MRNSVISEKITIFKELAEITQEIDQCYKNKHMFKTEAEFKRRIKQLKKSKRVRQKAIDACNYCRDTEIMHNPKYTHITIF